jgi:hypothetical protein
MKKILVLTIALVFMAGSAFAASFSTTSADGKLAFGDCVKNTQLYGGIGLSPKVAAYYVTDGDSTTTAQWYGISTVHPGGNTAYGTAQNLNNILHASYTTGDATATILTTIPDAKASLDQWPTTWTVD